MVFNLKRKMPGSPFQNHRAIPFIHTTHASLNACENKQNDWVSKHDDKHREDAPKSAIMNGFDNH